MEHAQTVLSSPLSRNASAISFSGSRRIAHVLEFSSFTVQCSSTRDGWGIGPGWCQVGDFPDADEVVQMLQETLALCAVPADANPVAPPLPAFDFSAHAAPRYLAWVDNETLQSIVYVSFKVPLRPAPDGSVGTAGVWKTQGPGFDPRRGRFVRPLVICHWPSLAGRVVPDL